MNEEKVIEILGLTKKFKSLIAVSDLDLTVYKGDVFGFLGPNGAGKSTTIRMMLSLIAPTSGTIKIFGKSLLSNRKDILKKVGAIVEKPDFYNNLTAYKNLSILGRLSMGEVSRKKIMEMLELVGLEKRYKSKVKTFSHGMKQRLGIAQALLHDPDLIILDEPTTGLDPQGMKEIRDLMVLLSREKGKTIFLSSHILSEIEIIANRMIILDNGKEVVEGKVSELLNKNKLKVTFEVDDNNSARNILEGTIWQDKVYSSIDNKIVFILEPEDISSLNKLFVENNVAVSAVIPTRSLEEYFLNITEKSNR
ncbi:MAG: ABC transporter ATP-binding protein [Bacteroidetes bacterium]|nr:ABC transporter ATP-binding protein [Bacteroidota bacterium]MCH8169607.1 ABC transporter ATP-binding protein [Bacteroidota bacterium]MCH8942221.1 ABC transporter ATP-binding protein [Bacteroidota bacterium]